MDGRICVVLEDDVYKKIRLHQAKLIKTNHKSYSFSFTINDVLRKHFMKIA